MSVTACNELPLERRGPKGVENGQLTQTYVRIFQVETDDVNDGPKTVIDYSDIPDIGDKHDEDKHARCYAIDPSPVSREVWKVVCRYTIDRKMWEAGINEKPTSRPPEITFDTVVYQKPAERAYKKSTDSGSTWSPTSITQGSPGVAVLNSAKQRFADPVMSEDVRLLIRIERNQRRFSPIEAHEYTSTVNDAAVTVAGLTIAARCGLMKKINGRKAWDNDGLAYWIVNYEIECKIDKHDEYILDQGYYFVAGDNWYRCEDAEGNETAEPVKLDGSGTVASPGDDEVYIGFQIKYPADWTDLGLPATA